MLVWGLLAADMRRHPRPKARTELHCGTAVQVQEVLLVYLCRVRYLDRSRLRNPRAT